MTEKSAPSDHPPASSPAADHGATDSGKCFDSDATISSPEQPVPSAATVIGEIGDFRLLRRIGAGGMGIVYEAEQQHPKRRVALKVIRGDRFVDETYVRLFQREAQALALLRHPAIAAIYESGHTPTGEHYFAMELAQGATLDHWLAARPSAGDLNRQELELRLRVFVEICAGVAYAHQRGVVHRDLKPSNVLITNESRPEPGNTTGSLPGVKILDFGLARITNADVAATMMETEVGAIRGTYSYMSPEQIRGHTENIDTRTDVYSLGVVLYQTLVGDLPYEVSGKPLHEVSRIICEQAPAPLVRTWKGPGEPDQDVETIIFKALEKDAARRYQSVTALAEDVSRFLQKQPILARPPSTMYQLRKMVQRHTAAFIAAAAAVVLLAAGVIALSFQARTIARERDRANDEALAAQATNDYLVSLFKVADPSEMRGRNITVSELLNKAVERLESGLRDQPVVRARVTDAIGQVYLNLGLYDEAYSILEESLRLQRELSPEETIYEAHALNALATVSLYRGDFDESERLFKGALAMRRRLYPEISPEVAESLNNFGIFLMRKGSLAEAQDLLAEALAIQGQLEGGRDEAVASMLNNLAYCAQHLGDHDEAERLNREALALRRELLGDDHPVIAQSLNNLGMDLYRNGEYDQAEALIREAVELNLRIYGRHHPATSSTRSALATVLRDAGKLAEAETIMCEVIAVDRSLLGENHPNVAEDTIKLASIEEKAGRLQPSEAHYRQALEMQRASFPDGSWQIATTTNLLGGCLTAQRRYDQAEQLLTESLAIIVNSFGEDHPRSAAARQRVIANYEAWGRPELASMYRHTGNGGG